ncbi:uncharacterized protein [Euphorbia lathyris]|uniref:uncharacterized protein isoform X1 n=1 Tax=Euphorbia lathyris TaxID=212925 RepID=UPI0033136B88
MSSITIDVAVADDNHFFKEGKDCAENENPMLSHQEEEVIKKRYGGILPKKKPLISKDHEHAFFDSADWALGKQGAEKPKAPPEALRPKLQPTPQQQLRSRRSAYAPPHQCQCDCDCDPFCKPVDHEDENSIILVHADDNIAAQNHTVEGDNPIYNS